MDTSLSRSLLLLLPLLLLFMLLLSSALPVMGDFSSPFAHESCSADITVPKGQESVIIRNGKPDESGRLYLYTYVYPEQGFEGVSLVVRGRTSTSTGWFKLSDACFQYRTWWVMLATVEVVNNDDSEDQYIKLQLQTEACSDNCLIKKRHRGELRFHVEAHGPSHWRHDMPNPTKCNFRGLPQKEPTLSYSSCKSPPEKPTKSRNSSTLKPLTEESEGTTPSTQPTSTTVVVVVIAAAVVTVVVIIVVVIVVQRNRQRKQTAGEDVVTRPSQGASSPSERVVVENTLYEPFENFNPRSPGTSGETVVVENSLYEPFENLKSPN